MVFNLVPTNHADDAGGGIEELEKQDPAVLATKSQDANESRGREQKSEAKKFETGIRRDQKRIDDCRSNPKPLKNPLSVHLIS